MHGGDTEVASPPSPQARCVPSEAAARRRPCLALALAAASLAAACAPPPVVAPRTLAAPAGSASPAAAGRSAADQALLDDLERRTFLFFWELADPRTRLIPDRWPTPSFSSVAAVGFGLNAYAIGAERGYVTRAAAAERTLATLTSLLSLPQGPQPTGVAGDRGFFYHFLVMDTGMRFETVELSTIDTTLLLAGVLASGRYFDRDTPAERAIRERADALYRRADWAHFQELPPHPPRVSMGWRPEDGFIDYDWRGYNEAILLYVLALGSPTHPVTADAFDAYTSTYTWGTFEGQEHLAFDPLFGHEYSHAWIDFRGIRDRFLGAKGIDYFENSRRATLAQRAYAMRNPGGFAGYGPNVWGLSACDGPFDGTMTVAGKVVEFHTYAARGAALTRVSDDGTLAPHAVGAALPFAPEVVLPALRTMKERWGEHLYGRYGFVDAFNPTLSAPRPVQMGRIVPGVGWFDGDYLGIDQGVLLAMLENERSGLLWRLMRDEPAVRRGLERAGFRGGWLAAR